MQNTVSVKELRNQYNVSKSTLTKWLKMVPDLLYPGQKRLNRLTPAQVDKIYKHIGEPDKQE